MKKLRLLVGVASLVLGGSAFGTTYTDVQHVNDPTDGVFITGTRPYNGSFNIVSPGSNSYTITGYPGGTVTFTDAGGYILGTPISDATASFFIFDSTSGDTDKVDISLNGLSAIHDGTLIAGTNWHGVFAINGNNGVLSVLESSGHVGYIVSSDAGEFTLRYAVLQANTAVPDAGSTVALLGLGLVGLAGLARRVRQV